MYFQQAKVQRDKNLTKRQRISALNNFPVNSEMCSFLIQQVFRYLFIVAMERKQSGCLT